MHDWIAIAWILHSPVWRRRPDLSALFENQMGSGAARQPQPSHCPRKMHSSTQFLSVSVTLSLSADSNLSWNSAEVKHPNKPILLVINHWSWAILMILILQYSHGKADCDHRSLYWTMITICLAMRISLRNEIQTKCRQTDNKPETAKPPKLHFIFRVSLFQFRQFMSRFLYLVQVEMNTTRDTLIYLYKLKRRFFVE